MSVPVEPHTLYTEVMGSIEKPLCATLVFKYLSNDKPIQWRHYSAIVLNPLKAKSEMEKADI